MQEDLLQAIKSQPDYSNKFTEHISEIQNEFHEQFGVSIEHDKDMNYSKSQAIKLYLNDKDLPVNHDSNNSVVKVVILISAKGRFFTILYLRKQNDSSWSVKNNSVFPRKYSDFEKIIIEILSKKGYYLLEEELLDKPIPKHFTEMDGLQATLFEVLFSELY